MLELLMIVAIIVMVYNLVKSFRLRHTDKNKSYNHYVKAILLLIVSTFIAHYLLINDYNEVTTWLIALN